MTAPRTRLLITAAFLIWMPACAPAPDRQAAPNSGQGGEPPKPSQEPTMTTTNTLEMRISRSFDAPLSAVWDAWSKEELLRQWWGPAGFTCPLARVDFVEGGTSLVAMKAPEAMGGQTIYNTWRYTRIREGELIEFVQGFSDRDGKPISPADLGLPDTIPSEVRHVLTFKATGGDTTDFTVTEYGYTSPEIVETSKQGMQECLDKLAVLLARK